MAARPSLAIADTGVANLASVLASFVRLGLEPRVSGEADFLAGADLAVLPGVGSFGPAAARLAEGGLGEALAWRFREARPTLAICLGMQLLFEGSEEGPGARGLGILAGRVGRFSPGPGLPPPLPLPQLGWNRLEGSGDDGFLVRPGWAYFANSYRVTACPPGFVARYASYGEAFCASLESVAGQGRKRGALLLCQFHPELSGAWGQGLLASWAGLAAPPRPAPAEVAP